LGVTKTGEVSTTNLVPVPVWEAIEVALPTEVITPVKLAFVASFPFNFCIADRIESDAVMVPAPDVYPVRTLAITGAFVKVVAFPTEVTSPVRFALVVTVAALPEILVWSPVLEPDTEVVPVTAKVGVAEPEITTPFTLVGVIAPLGDKLVSFPKESLTYGRLSALEYKATVPVGISVGIVGAAPLIRPI